MLSGRTQPKRAEETNPGSAGRRDQMTRGFQYVCPGGEQKSPCSRACASVPPERLDLQHLQCHVKTLQALQLTKKHCPKRQSTVSQIKYSNSIQHPCGYATSAGMDVLGTPRLTCLWKATDVYSEKTRSRPLCNCVLSQWRNVVALSFQRLQVLWFGLNLLFNELTSLLPPSMHPVQPQR
ncbi:uncharacterized protein [Struthio camelus]|uniref:uncharacterized protein n=1 Tax=Struthio camelus TaxID=8801 RepID=UPI0036040616